MKFAKKRTQQDGHGMLLANGGLAALDLVDEVGEVGFRLRLLGQLRLQVVCTYAQKVRLCKCLCSVHVSKVRENGCWMRLRRQLRFHSLHNAHKTTTLKTNVSAATQ